MTDNTFYTKNHPTMPATVFSTAQTKQTSCVIYRRPTYFKLPGNRSIFNYFYLAPIQM